MNFYFYSRFDSGHRKEYIKYCEEELSGERLYMFSSFFKRKKIIFLMIEECFLAYFFISIIRSLFRMETYGLLFRGLEVIEKHSLRHRIKYFLLCILKCNPYIKTISIIPFFIAEKLDEIADDWIFDIQFYDLDFFRRTAIDNVKEDIAIKVLPKLKLNGRKIICALGRQDINKGSKEFVRIYNEYESLRDKFIFVMAGACSGISQSDCEKFESNGGILINRNISNGELLRLYEISDLIWACYSPKYNQSSGIFGRALQLNKMVIVRVGSVTEKICLSIDFDANLALKFPATEDDIFKLNNTLIKYSKSNLMNKTLASVIE